MPEHERIYYQYKITGHWHNHAQPNHLTPTNHFYHRYIGVPKSECSLLYVQGNPGLFNYNEGNCNFVGERPISGWEANMESHQYEPIILGHACAHSRLRKNGHGHRTSLTSCKMQIAYTGNTSIFWSQFNRISLLSWVINVCFVIKGIMRLLGVILSSS